MKTKLKSLGFTAGHVHLLLVAVALFAVLVVAKSDISLKTLFANADDKQEMLTYDDIKNKVIAEAGPLASSGDDADSEAQMALLDRKEDGQVLGEAIGLGAIPAADQMFSKENLELIPIKQTVGTNEKSVAAYFSSMRMVEAHFDAAGLFGSLNSSDPEVLKEAQTRANDICATLKELPVPSDLVDYHKYSILYYTSLSFLADNFATNNFDSNFQENSKAMFSLTDKLTSMKQEFGAKYNTAF